jgi:ligand-binding sensor domain-containing protein
MPCSTLQRLSLKSSNTFPDRRIPERRLRGLLLAGIGALCLVKMASALDPAKAMSQYIHQRWGAESGFSGGSVFAISQTADGYLWIGTERGLVRFDGFDFTLIQQPIPDSPRIGPVRGLVLDGQGNLWIRLDDARMLLYHDGKFEDAFARFHLPQNVYTAMSRDYEGGMLFSGFGNQTLQLLKGKIEAIGRDFEVPGTVLSLTETRDHRVWVGTRDGGLFRSNEGHFSNVPKELANSKINTLLPIDNGGLSSGGIWIGTDHGIVYWDGNRLAKTGLPTAIDKLQVLTMTRDLEGNIWAGTDHGLIRITAQGEVSLGLLNNDPNNQVTTIYEDLAGDLWFGGSRGIERLRDGMFATYSTAEGLPSEGNGPVFADSDGRIWSGPLSGGLYWLKGGRVGQIVIAGLNDDVVYSISGGNREIWLGRQHGGLTVLTRSGESFVARTYTESDGLAQNSVFSVHRNRDGTVWAGTVNSGVSVLRKGKFTSYTTASGLASNTLNSIVEGYDGTMWFATANGLNSFTDGVWMDRSVHDGLPSANVKCIFEDSRHVLWIATSGGLSFMSSGNIAVPHNLPELLREQIYGIAEDGLGSIWFVTSDHVLQVNRDRLLTGTLDDSDVQSYGIADGIQEVEGVSRDRVMAADSLGYVWVSLVHGVAVAHPRLTLRNSTPVTVRINSVSADGKQVNLLESPKLAPGSGTITFNYAGTDLAASDRVRYRYKLDGADQRWSDAVALRQVIYKNLGPGSYRFRIVASNYVGLWNGPETDIPFVIEPKFWQTWWFRPASALALILAVFLVFRLRTYQLRKLCAGA